MEANIRARFLQAFDFVLAKEVLTSKELCLIIDQSPTYISAIRGKENTTIKASLLGSLCAKYRYINPFWVLTGEGDMQAIPEDLKSLLSKLDKKVDERMAQLIQALIEIRTPKTIYQKPSNS
jgi:hypothetical protein